MAAVRVNLPRLPLVIALVLAACTPTPTPLPVALPPTSTLPGTSAPLPRFAIDPVYAAYLDAYGGMTMTAEIIQIVDPAVWASLPADLTGLYDAVFTLGAALADAQTGMEIVWGVQFSALPPLDDAELLQTVRAALLPDADTSAQRTALANFGYPDGLTLRAALAAPPPAELAIDALARIGVELRADQTSADDAITRVNTGAATLAILALPAAVIPDGVVVFARRPLLYRAAPGFVVHFDPFGRPISAAR